MKKSRRTRFDNVNKRNAILKERPITEQDQVLLDILRNKYAQLGRSPTISEIPQASMIKARFGFWKNALEAAGLPPMNAPEQQRLRQRGKEVPL